MAWFDPSSHSSTGPLSQPTPKPMQPGQRPEEGYFQSRSSLSKGHRNELKKAINFAVKLTPQFTKSLFFLLPKSVAGMKTTKHSMATAATAALSAKTQIHDLDGRWSSAASSSVTNETNQFIIQCNSARVRGKHRNVQPISLPQMQCESGCSSILSGSMLPRKQPHNKHLLLFKIFCATAQ